MYAMVFVARYLNLFTSYISLYNTLMKLFFLGSSFYIVYLMKVKLKSTWNASLDTFRLEYLLGPCAALSLLVHYGRFYNLMEIAWAFSIYLESIAILPQLFQLSRTGEAETITSHYLFALGAYRALYLLNWGYRFIYEPSFHDWISVLAGLVQTVLYVDFFYVYFTKVVAGKKFKLPA